MVRRRRFTSQPAGATSDTISQRGVVAAASTAHEYGQYADGTYWWNANGGNISVSSITPASSADRNGAMVNPGNRSFTSDDTAQNALGSHQGYDSQGGTDTNAILAYDGSFNVDPGKTASALVLSEGTIVKALSDATPPASGEAVITDLVPITIVASAPAAGSFRPGIAAADKTSHWTTADIQWGILPGLTAPASCPTAAEAAAAVQYIFSMQYTNNLNCENIDPSNHHGDYGRDIAYQIEKALLFICTDQSRADLEPVVYGIIQLGIDVAARMQEGGVFPDLGGGSHWAKAALVITAELLDDAGLRALANSTTTHALDRAIYSVSSTAYTDDQPIYFPLVSGLAITSGGTGYTASDVLTIGGLARTQATVRVDTVDGSGAITAITVLTAGYYYQEDAPAAATGGTGSGATFTNARPRNIYLPSMVGMPEWSDQHTWSGDDYHAWNFDASYRSIIATSAAGHVLACRLITGAQATWNNATLFDYFDLYWSFKRGATPGALNQYTQFCWDMWDTFRDFSGDVTAPTLASAATDTAGLGVALIWNEVLDQAEAPAKTDFTVKIGGSPVTIDRCILRGKGVFLALDTAIEAGDVVTVSYTPGTDKVQDIAGNAAGSLTDQAVTNNVTSGLAVLNVAAAWQPSTSSLFTDAGSTPVSSDADQVYTMKDVKGTSSYDFVQATSGSRPAYYSNSGKPYVQFDGTDDFMQTASYIYAAGDDVLLGFAIELLAAGNFPFLMDKAAAGNGGVMVLLDGTSRTLRPGVRTTSVQATTLTGKTIAINTPLVWTISWKRSAGECKHYLNGVYQGQIVVTPADLTIGSALCIGRGNADNGRAMNVRLFGGVVDTDISKRTTVESALAALIA